MKKVVLLISSSCLLLLILSSILWSSQPHVSVEQNLSNQRLEGYYNNKKDFEEAFNSNLEVSKESVYSGVVSHHFLVREIIAEFFLGIDFEGIDTVYIVGPDHFQETLPKDTYLLISLLDWDTPYGVLESDKDLINHLSENLNVEIQDTPFRLEHSIYTLIPFLKKVAPDVKVVPLILKASNNYNTYLDLGRRAYSDNSIVIVSADFSHNATRVGAKENDRVSIDCLKTGNVDCIEQITSDCNHCFTFMYGFLSGKDLSFKLVSNEQSINFGEQNEENITSYVVGYFVPKE